MANARDIEEEEEYHDVDWEQAAEIFDPIDPLLENPQLRCVMMNDIYSLKKLLKAGRSVNVINNRGETALHLAVLKQKDEMLDYLLTVKDLRLDSQNFKGETALLIAVSNQYDTFTKKLLNAGADPSIGDNEGMTPLHVNRNYSICRLLLEHDADVDARNADGATPLLYALQKNGASLAHMMLYYGADAQQADNDGLTPLQAAMWHRYRDLEEILFLYTFDEDEVVDMSWVYIYLAMKNSSPLFHTLLNVCNSLVYEKSDLDLLARDLFHLDPEYFKIFIGKFRPSLVDMFDYVGSLNKPTPMTSLNTSHSRQGCLSILETLEAHGLLNEMVQVMADHPYFVLFEFAMDQALDLEALTQVVINLVSRGMPLTHYAMEVIYRKYGFCEMFRMLLHCDFCDVYFMESSHYLMAPLIFDVNITIELCLEYPKLYIKDRDSVLSLFEQFALPELKQYCLSEFSEDEEIVARVEALPALPSLLELSRNATRRLLIEKLHRKTPMHLYTSIDNLPICQAYKDILSFKRKLYV